MNYLTIFHQNLIYAIFVVSVAEKPNSYSHNNILDSQ